MNCVNYDKYKDTGSVFIATVFLDSLCSEFLAKAKNIPGLEKVIRYTEKARSLGLGLLGFHSYLQENNIAIEEYLAHRKNIEIFSHLKEETEAATRWLAETLGEPEWCKGFNRRNTHLCVTGDTKILTKNGQVPIENLVGVETEVWNGSNWSTVTPFRTGKQKILKVNFSNGMELHCTENHKFLVATPKRDTKSRFGIKTLEVEACNLRIGDCLPKFKSPTTDSEEILPYAYTSGLFCGDGSMNNAKAGLYPRKELRLYGNKKFLSSFVDWKSTNTWGGGDMVRGYLPDAVLDKFIVPHTYSRKCKTLWLCGLIDSDGYATSKGLSISMKDRSFAQEVALLVQSLGGTASVSTCKRVGGYSASSDIYYQVGISIFSCAAIFQDVCPNRVKLPVGVSKASVGSEGLVEVVSIEALPEEQETFCFTEKEYGTGIFGGVLTKQCAIAPNVSSSTLAGQVSQGITPWFANVFLEPTASGELLRINPAFLKLATEKGKYNKALITNIINNKGSVQHLSWLTDHEKLVFRTAFEIDQRALLRLASARQPYIDQGQSLNLHFSSEEDESYITEVTMEMLLDENIKGAYYLRSESGVQASKDTCIACES